MGFVNRTLCTQELAPTIDKWDFENLMNDPQITESAA